MKYSIGILLWALCVVPVHGAVIITEFSSKSPEWVELYNTSSEDISLEGWYIEDRTGSALTGTSTFSELFGVLQTHSIRVFDGSGLNDGGDSITLFDGEGNEVDSVSYGSASSAHVEAPSTGEVAVLLEAGWVLSASSSKGLPNEEHREDEIQNEVEEEEAQDEEVSQEITSNTSVRVGVSRLYRPQKTKVLEKKGKVLGVSVTAQESEVENLYTILLSQGWSSGDIQALKMELENIEKQARDIEAHILFMIEEI